MKNYSSDDEIIAFMDECIDRLKENNFSNTTDISEAYNICVFYNDHPPIQGCIFQFLLLADEITFGKVSPIIKQRIDGISTMHH